MSDGYDAQLQEERIRKLAKKWQKRMRLDWWQIDHLMNQSHEVGDNTVIASTSALWQYSDAAITWHLPRVALLNDAELENTLVHELVHCLLDPMTGQTTENAQLDKLLDEKMEYSTERVAQAILGTWHAGD